MNEVLDALFSALGVHALTSIDEGHYTLLDIRQQRPAVVQGIRGGALGRFGWGSLPVTPSTGTGAALCWGLWRSCGQRNGASVVRQVTRWAAPRHPCASPPPPVYVLVFVFAVRAWLRPGVVSMVLLRLLQVFQCASRNTSQQGASTVPPFVHPTRVKQWRKHALALWPDPYRALWQRSVTERAPGILLPPDLVVTERNRPRGPMADAVLGRLMEARAGLAGRCTSWGPPSHHTATTL